MGEDWELSNQDAIKAAQFERDRTLISAREVEDALSRAAGGTNWVDDLKSSLGSLQEAMSEERRELDRPASLLALISSERPRRYGPRVRGIREQYEDISTHSAVSKSRVARIGPLPIVILSRVPCPIGSSVSMATSDTSDH